MNKKIIAICLCVITACGIIVGCNQKQKEADPISVIVTDDNGVAITDKNGEIVTEMAIPVTDKDGNVVTEIATNAKGQVITDKEGNTKTAVVTESAASGKTDSTNGGKSTSATKKTAEANSKVPYSTTAAENNKSIDDWTFGSYTDVGCYAPAGWKNETVNQVVKDGSDTRVVICPVNYLSGLKLKNADDYASYLKQIGESAENKETQISFAKEVYDGGVGIAMLYKAKRDVVQDEQLLGKYHMTYIFQTGENIRVYFVLATSEEEAKISIEPIILNTYYRGKS